MWTRLQTAKRSPELQLNCSSVNEDLCNILFNSQWIPTKGYVSSMFPVKFPHLFPHPHWIIQRKNICLTTVKSHEIHSFPLIEETISNLDVPFKWAQICPLKTYDRGRMSQGRKRLVRPFVPWEILFLHRSFSPWAACVRSELFLARCPIWQSSNSKVWIVWIDELTHRFGRDGDWVRQNENKLHHWTTRTLGSSSSLTHSLTLLWNRVVCLQRVSVFVSLTKSE